MIVFATASALLALAVVAIQLVSVLHADEGDERMRAVAGAIREGARAFLRREYAVVAGVGAVIVTAIAVVLGTELAIGFVLGAAGSALASVFGVVVSVRANVRTANLAARGDLSATACFAFRASSVIGMAIAGLALLELVG